MALAEHSSAPPVKTGNTGSDHTTDSFTPPDNSLVLVMAGGGWHDTATSTVAITSSDGGGTWTGIYQSDDHAFHGVAAIAWKYYDFSPGAITVTANFTNIRSDSTSHLVTKVITGANRTDPIGSTSGRNRGDGGSVFEDVDPQAIGSLIYISANLNDTTDTDPTENANTVTLNYQGDFANDNAVWAYKYNGTSPSNDPILDIGGTIDDTSPGAIVHVEVLPSTGAAWARDPSDALGLTDDFSLTLDMGRSFSETEGLTDSVQTTHDAQRDFSETLGLSDNFQTTLDMEHTYSDSLGLTDEVQVTRQTELFFADNLGLTDGIDTQSGRILNFTDLLGLTDDFTRPMELNRFYSESMSLSDVIDSDRTDPTAEIGEFATTLVLGPARIFVADFGTPEPQGLDILNDPSSESWTDIGCLLGGAELSIDQEYETVDLVQEPNAPMRRLKRRRAKVKIVVAEPSHQNLLYAVNSGTMATGAGYQTYEPPAISRATQLDYRAVIIYGWAPGLSSNGYHKRRAVILRKCLSIEDVNFTYSKEDQTLIPVAWAVHYIDELTPAFKIIDEK